MKFYQSLIRDTQALLAPLPQTRCAPAAPWPDAGAPQVVLLRDAAFELRGVGFDLVTSDAVADGLTVIGPDLPALRQDGPFARISLVETAAQADEQAAHTLIKQIEYVKYHYYPDGYMLRSASDAHRETVRVSRRALQRGLGFAGVGALLLEKYHALPQVRHAHIFFVTAPAADYAALRGIAARGAEITRALDSVLNGMTFDCDACGLKPLCDEVEGMRALHFGAASKNN